MLYSYFRLVLYFLIGYLIKMGVYTLCTEPYWALLSPTDSHWAPRTLTELHWAPTNPNDLYWLPLTPTESHWAPLSPIDPHGAPPGSKVSIEHPHWPHWRHLNPIEPSVGSTYPHWVIFTIQWPIMTLSCPKWTSFDHKSS